MPTLTGLMLSRSWRVRLRSCRVDVTHGALIVASALLLSACSDDDAAQDDHVLKEKVQTIDKARDVERQLGEAAARMKKASEKATAQ